MRARKPGAVKSDTVSDLAPEPKNESGSFLPAAVTSAMYFWAVRVEIEGQFFSSHAVKSPCGSASFACSQSTPVRTAKTTASCA